MGSTPRSIGLVVFMGGFGLLAASCASAPEPRDRDDSSGPMALTPSSDGIALYSENRCEGTNVGLTDGAVDQLIQFTTNERFANDEARSLLVNSLGPGTVIRLFDHPAGDTSDDWVEILVKREVRGYCVGTFETSFEDDDISLRFSSADGLDGEISLMVIDRVNVEVSSADPEPTTTAVPTSAATATQMPTVTPLPEVPFLPDTECIPTATEREFATVLDVIDGETIDILIDGIRFRLRYIGIHAPDAEEPFFNQSTSRNAELVLGKTVTLVRDASNSDEEGNLLRYVMAGNVFVNHSLIEEGYAYAVESSPNVACSPLFAGAQDHAVTEGAGVWSVNPTPPAPTHTPASNPNVQITVILYKGTVPGVEGDEFVQITNQGSIAVNLEGWRLNAGDLEQDFYFPGFQLDPGLSCRIYTDEDHPEHCGFSFSLAEEIWINEGDCGYLYDDEGAQVSKYCY